MHFGCGLDVVVAGRGGNIFTVFRVLRSYGFLPVSISSSTDRSQVGPGVMPFYAGILLGSKVLLLVPSRIKTLKAV